MHTVVEKLQFNHTSQYKKYPSAHQQRQLSKRRLPVATTKTEKNIYNNPSLDFHQHLINQCPQRHQTTHKRNKQTNTDDKILRKRESQHDTRKSQIVYAEHKPKYFYFWYFFSYYNNNDDYDDKI